MTAPEVDFVSVHALITQMLTDVPEAIEPREIAAMVAERIPEDLRIQILVTALIPQVRNVIARQRNAAFDNIVCPKPTAPPAPSSRFPGEPRPIPATGPSSIQSERLVPVSRSAKVEGIRDWWAEMLRARVHVGESRWLPLGECGVTDLEFAERERRDHAEREIRRARMYLALRELLDKYEVATVAELPADAARAVVS